jgi:histidinol-phosphatase
VTDATGPWADDLALALDLADAADALTTQRFGARDLVVDTKPDLTPVSDADRATEALLRRLIGERRSADLVAGEEEGGVPAEGGWSGRRWVLDPIDGTKNYVRGVPVWATLIALVADGRPVVGVVSAPALGRRWWAAQGAGSWAGGALVATPRRLTVSAVTDLADASLSYSDREGWPAGGAAFDDLAGQVWRTRAYGDFWSHVLVAEGAVDLAVEPELSAWDVAALVPVVEEAGGRITSTTGGDVLAGPGGLTTNGRLHDAATGVLAGRSRRHPSSTTGAATTAARSNQP